MPTAANKPLISVIVPVYNTETYLEACVDSILCQTYGRLELLLVDDGSSDRCPAICARYAAQDARVRVIHQTNQGQSAARRTALFRAAGEWIAFVDSDDSIKPDMLECLYDLTDRYQAPMALCGYMVLRNGERIPHGTGGKSGQWTPEQALGAMMELSGPEFFLWNKIYHRSLFEGMTFPAFDVCEDVWINLEILKKISLCAYTDVPHYMYRVHTGSTIASGFAPRHMQIAESGRRVYAYVCTDYPALSEKALHYWMAGEIGLINKLAAMKPRDAACWRFLRREIRENLWNLLRGKGSAKIKLGAALICWCAPLYVCLCHIWFKKYR